MQKFLKDLSIGSAIIFAGITYCSSLSAAQTIPVKDKAVLHGLQLVKTNCAQCHEINLDGESPNPDAPPFWMVGDRRDITTIAQMLLTKSSPKHTEMPSFDITNRQANDIAAWIAWVQPIAHGKRIAEENCSRCHAVSMDDESNHKQAPPFRNLSIFYPIESLEEAFAEQIEIGHPDMPKFKVSRVQLEDILAYITSLQEN